MSNRLGGVWERLAGTVEADPTEGDGADGTWAALSERADPGAFRPQLAPDIEVKQFPTRWGEGYAMAANPREMLHYRLEAGEVELLPLMDGTRTVKEIVVERFRDSGELEMEGVADLVRQLHEGNFLQSTFTDVEGMVNKAIDPETTVGRKAREFVTDLRLEWSGADRFVRAVYRRGLRVLFTKPALVVSVIVALAGLVAFFANVRSSRFDLAGQSLAIGFLLLLFLQLFHIFLHELGHGSVLVHYGRKVKAAGFFIFFGAPAFYIESSDGLMLDRRRRIIQSAAGPFAGLLVAGAVSIYVFLVPASPVSALLYKFTVLAYLAVFMNSLPMLELDGYWILADSLQIPDLRPRSIAFVRHDLARKLWRRERFTGRETGLALYGVIGIVFTIFSFYTAYFFWEAVFGGLVGRLWAGGTTTRLILIVLGLFVGGPLIRGLINVLRSLWQRAKALIDRVRFRLQSGWRVEAARLIDALPLFEDVPEDVLSDLAGRVRLKTVPRDREIVRQGDRADAFYVVRRGTLQVEEENPETGARRVLRKMGPGESFGELGLLRGTPRAVTIRALEPTQVFEIDESTFDRLLADMIRVPSFAPVLQETIELRELRAFAHLEPSEASEVLAQGEWVDLSPGEVVMEEGEPGDAFYAIGSGQVEVLVGGERQATLVRGDFFGEVALLMDVPRTATVVTATPVRAFRLERDGFDRLIAKSFRRGTLDPHMPSERPS